MRVVAVVVLELDLFEVGRKVLDRDVVVRPDDGALEQRPHALDGVGVHVSPDVLLAPVIHGLVHRVLVRHHGGIRGEFVRVNGGYAVGHRVRKERPDGRDVAAVGDAEAHLPAPLDRPEHRGLAVPRHPATGQETRDWVAVGLRVALLAPVPRLVHLHDGRREREVMELPHRAPDAVREEPRRLVGHAEHPLQLVRAHALLGLRDDVGGEQPLGQRQLGVLKHRPGAYREVHRAVEAAERVAPGHAIHAERAALGARHAIRPAHALQEVACCILGAVGADQGREVESLGSHRRLHAA